MSDQPETLAAILADFRKFALRAAEEDKTISPESVLLLADKVEAAVEREREEDRQLAAIAESDEAFARCARCDRPERAPGNASAMREALTVFVDSMQWLCDGDERGIFKKQFAPLLSDARAALSAPARNCDRFADCNSAWKAYNAIADRERLPGFDFWLFAPAEGGEE